MVVVGERFTWANITRVLGIILAAQQVYAAFIGKGFEPVIFFGAFALMGFASVLPPGGKV